MKFKKIFFFITFITSTFLTISGCLLKNAAASPLSNIKNILSTSIIWRNSIGNGTKNYYTVLYPIYNKNIIYAVSRDGTIKAINFSAGSLLWKTNLTNQKKLFNKKNRVRIISSGLAISKDQLYIGTENQTIISLNKNNGKIIWEKNIEGEALSRPVITQNLLLIHTEKNILQALDSKTGENKWKIYFNFQKKSMRGKSTPKIFHNLAILGDGDGKLNIININTGKIIWKQFINQDSLNNEFRFSNDINSTPFIDKKRSIAYVISCNRCASIDLHSGKIIWNQNIGSINNIISTKDKIYVVDQKNQIFSIKKNNGEIFWKQNILLHCNLTSPEIYKDYLIIGDNDGYLNWININNGNFVSRNKIDNSGFLSPPIVINEKIVMQSKNGDLYLLIPKTIEHKNHIII